MLEIKNYGICRVAVAPVRASNSDTAEIVTQLLFGDHVIVLEKGQPWIKIRFEADDYEGWMDFKQLTYISPEEYQNNTNSEKQHLCDPIGEINGPNGKERILFGSELPRLKDNQITLGEDVYTFDEAPKTTAPDLIESALMYLNAPYLWGGKSLFGVDCSGFIQNIYRVRQINLPRDASKQVHSGELISYEDRQVGDIPFFINSKGIVHHVGILVEKDKIIHAAGCIRIDPFDEKGIFRTDLNTYTHHYHSIKRYS